MDRRTYNALDCIATRQVYDALGPQVDKAASLALRASMGLQGAALGVQMRGLRLDRGIRDQLIWELDNKMVDLEGEIASAAGKPLNPQSPLQIQEFLYQDLGLRAQRNHKTEKVTSGEDALIAISKRTVAVDTRDLSREEVTRRKDVAARIAELVLEYRDLSKQASSLSDSLLENGRMRTTLVVSGTESYRFSAHKACTDKGHNQQNVDKRLRRCFVADPGYLFGQADQERAESMTVAYCSGDQAYIDAHLKGNTHVTVARILWPERNWSGEEKGDKALAKGTTVDGKAPHGRNSLYDLAKMAQHGLNYLLSARGVAVHTGLRVADATRATANYFKAFPGIREWQRKVIEDVKRFGVIYCPGGFKHVIMGRRWEESTHRAAISRIPQSIVAWTNHIALFRLFYGLDDDNFRVLGHVHDAILFQARPETWPHYRERFVELTRINWPIGGRIMTIPFEIKTGSSWGEV